MALEEEVVDVPLRKGAPVPTLLTALGLAVERRMPELDTPVARRTLVADVRADVVLRTWVGIPTRVMRDGIVVFNDAVGRPETEEIVEVVNDLLVLETELEEPPNETGSPWGAADASERTAARAERAANFMADSEVNVGG